MSSTDSAHALDHLLADLAEQLTRIDDAWYARFEATIFRSSVGGHCRHLLDHVRALLDALDELESGAAPAPAADNAPVPTVYYDRRARGTSIETDRVACLAEIARQRRDLRELRVDLLACPLRVEQIVIPGQAPVYPGSNVARELVFVFHHGVHHLALIAARLRHDGLEIPASFGMAPATIATLQN